MLHNCSPEKASKSSKSKLNRLCGRTLTTWSSGPHTTVTPLYFICIPRGHQLVDDEKPPSSVRVTGGRPRCGSGRGSLHPPSGASVDNARWGLVTVGRLLRILV